jgi:hypothetical protein
MKAGDETSLEGVKIRPVSRSNKLSTQTVKTKPSTREARDETFLEGVKIDLVSRSFS